MHVPGWKLYGHGRPQKLQAMILAFQIAWLWAGQAVEVRMQHLLLPSPGLRCPWSQLQSLEGNACLLRTPLLGGLESSEEQKPMLEVDGLHKPDRLQTLHQAFLHGIQSHCSCPLMLQTNFMTHASGNGCLKEGGFPQVAAFGKAWDMYVHGKSRGASAFVRLHTQDIAQGHCD